MRNVDEIKRLERELGRYQKKVADQQKEITAMRDEREEMRSGLTELNRAVDALCIAIALKFGAQVGADAWETMLDSLDVDALMRAYAVAANPADGGGYGIRVTRRADE